MKPKPRITSPHAEYVRFRTKRQMCLGDDQWESPKLEKKQEEGGKFFPFLSFGKGPEGNVARGGVITLTIFSEWLG